MHREEQTEQEKGKIYPAFFTRDCSEFQDVMSGTVRVDDDGHIIEAWDCDGFQFMWKGYEIDILK